MNHDNFETVDELVLFIHEQAKNIENSGKCLACQSENSEQHKKGCVVPWLKNICLTEYIQRDEHYWEFQKIKGTFEDYLNGDGEWYTDPNHPLPRIDLTSFGAANPWIQELAVKTVQNKLEYKQTLKGILEAFQEDYSGEKELILQEQKTKLEKLENIREELSEMGYNKRKAQIGDITEKRFNELKNKYEAYLEDLNVTSDQFQF